MSGLEFRDGVDLTGLEGPPLTPSNSMLWNLPIPSNVLLSDPVSGQPLLGYDSVMDGFGDASHGLGLPERIMVPSLWLRGSLRLEYQEPYVLRDNLGSAMGLITWRTEYERSDYNLAWPKLKGSAVVVRPDLFQRLESDYGALLRLRDVIVAPTEILKGAQNHRS